MKKFISMILICALTVALLGGCDRKPAVPQEDDSQQVGSFAPETTAVASGGLVQAIDYAQPAEDAQPSVPDEASEPVQAVAPDEPVQDEVSDEPIEEEPSLEPAPAVTEAPANDTVIQPFATATPQPNVTVNSYSEVSGTGLGFKMSYPSDWNNIPGRSTVCYVQPLENGTTYPARVAVTMKKLAHRCTNDKAQQELVEYLKLLMSQYDASTFEVDKELNIETKFMGNKAMSTTYLAYDGPQEIKGYVILSYFEHYVFIFHFLCAYEDYEAFQPAMTRMRDSVLAEQEIIDAE